MRRALLVDIDDTVVDWIRPATDAVVAAIADRLLERAILAM